MIIQKSGGRTLPTEEKKTQSFKMIAKTIDINIEPIIIKIGIKKFKKLFNFYQDLMDLYYNHQL